MRSSNFNKLFTTIMQSLTHHSTYDKTEAYGITAHKTQEFNPENNILQALDHGQPVIDPSDGQPVYWEVMAVHYPGWDMITKQKFPKDTTVFSYKPCKLNSDKFRKFVTLDTYENATPIQQQQLNLIGLTPGFKYDLAMEDVEDINEVKLQKTQYRFTRRGNNFSDLHAQTDFSLPADRVEEFINLLKNHDLVQEYENLYDEVMSGIGTTYDPSELAEAGYTLITIGIVKKYKIHQSAQKIIFQIMLPLKEAFWFNYAFKEAVETIRSI